MADPRKRVVLDGLNAKYATFKIDNSTITYSATAERGSDSVDLAVTLSADDTVALAADGEFVLGKLLLVEADNYANVQIGGLVTLPGGTSATLTRGGGIVGDLLVSAKGYIRVAAHATTTETLLARGHIINNGTPTAVVVLL